MTRLDAAARDAADADPADVRRKVERRDLELQRRFWIGRANRHVRENRLEQRTHVAFAGRRIERRVAVQARCVDDREVELLFGRAKLVEQVEGLVDDPVDPRARTVDLVDDDDRLQTERERLLRDEARLRHRTLDGVDQQQHRVDHRQHALHLATEVRVPRRVDDVDVRAFVFDRAVLRENRDPALFFDVVRVHHPLGNLLVLAEGAGLAEQLVDERGLAVVDVSDDGDVAKGAGHRNLEIVERANAHARQSRGHVRARCSLETANYST
ncbi:hypothetical protein BDI4_720005 [Burkholderia diffusa]|nr:hypothetical protein BDI4_720005 [Burkholderia diffusa]